MNKKRSTLIQPVKTKAPTIFKDVRKPFEPKQDSYGNWTVQPDPTEIVRDGRLVFLYISVNERPVLDCRDIVRIDWTKINNGDFHAYDENLDIDIWASSKVDLNKAVQEAIWEQWKKYWVKMPEHSWTKNETLIHHELIRQFKLEHIN